MLRILTILLILLGSPSLAATAEVTAEHLSLQEALTRGLERNFNLLEPVMRYLITNLD